MAEVIPDWIENLNGDSVTVRLSRPLMLRGQTLDTLTMRAPLVRDMRAAQREADSPEEVESVLFAGLAGYSGDKFDDQMRWSDWERLQRGYFCMLAAVELPAVRHADAHPAAQPGAGAADPAPASVADS